MDYDATKLHPETSKVLYLIRGVPGSGKSTLARILQAAYHTDDWYEADMYFERSGEYIYDSTKISAAHVWCQSAVSRAMGRSSHCIIVSNTFTRQWEIEPYRQMAHQLGYRVVEVTMNGHFDNVHGCPQETIDRMKARFEYV